MEILSSLHISSSQRRPSERNISTKGFISRHQSSTPNVQLMGDIAVQWVSSVSRGNAFLVRYVPETRLESNKYMFERQKRSIDDDGDYINDPEDNNWELKRIVGKASVPTSACSQGSKMNEEDEYLHNCNNYISTRDSSVPRYNEGGRFPKLLHNKDLFCTWTDLQALLQLHVAHSLKKPIGQSSSNWQVHINEGAKNSKLSSSLHLIRDQGANLHLSPTRNSSWWNLKLSSTERRERERKISAIIWPKWIGEQQAVRCITHLKVRWLTSAESKGNGGATPI